MIEKQKDALDKSKKVGTIFMDLFIVFDTFNHYLKLRFLKSFLKALLSMR